MIYFASRENLKILYGTHFINRNTFLYLLFYFAFLVELASWNIFLLIGMSVYSMFFVSWRVSNLRESQVRFELNVCENKHDNLRRCKFVGFCIVDQRVTDVFCAPLSPSHFPRVNSTRKRQGWSKLFELRALMSSNGPKQIKKQKQLPYTQHVISSVRDDQNMSGND